MTNGNYYACHYYFFDGVIMIRLMRSVKYIYLETVTVSLFYHNYRYVFRM